MNHSKAKVLIVEDDAIEAMGMEAVLTLVDAEVVGVAARVRDALLLAEKTRPDVVIFDVRLAGRRDGIEGALILHKRMGLPVVFVTAQSDTATIARASEAEPVAFLPKPVPAGELVEAVEQAVATHREV
ncbi:MAG TPA: response regulator [Alphaproteobacteria bacterium]|nr:response regulator [Alphaproteobacteria bacterium]